ncbi:MAG: hypothetical protein WCO55_03560 [Candidatus Falkowbacteria bacterium]
MIITVDESRNVSFEIEAQGLKHPIADYVFKLSRWQGAISMADIANTTGLKISRIKAIFKTGIAQPVEKYAINKVLQEKISELTN